MKSTSYIINNNHYFVPFTICKLDIFPQFMTHAMLVNISAIKEKPSVPVILDTFLPVMDLVASNVLLLTSIVKVKSSHHPHGMLPYVIIVMPVSQPIAVEQ